MRTSRILLLGACSVLAVAASVTFHAPQAAAQGRHRHRQAPADYRAAYFDLLDSLDRIERANARRDGRRVDRLVRRARRRAERLAHRGRYTRPVQAEPCAMDSRSFAHLRAAVRDASFRREQLTLVRNAAHHNWFSVDQVLRLMADVRTDRTRLPLAIALYPRVVDPEQWFRVQAAMDFRSNRRELMRQTMVVQASL